MKHVKKRRKTWHEVEGSWSDKAGYVIRRFLCKGKQNVLAESTLLAMAYNINKLRMKNSVDRTGKHLLFQEGECLILNLLKFLFIKKVLIYKAY